MQVLVENAIKQNIIAVGTPLTIRLYTQGPTLYIENNRHRKPGMTGMDTIGLQNIMMKYKLMHQVPVLIDDEEAVFRIAIPLINPLTDLTALGLYPQPKASATNRDS